MIKSYFYSLLFFILFHTDDAIGDTESDHILAFPDEVDDRFGEGSTRMIKQKKPKMQKMNKKQKRKNPNNKDGNNVQSSATVSNTPIYSPFLTKVELQDAVNEYCNNPSAFPNGRNYRKYGYVFFSFFTISMAV